MFSFDQSFVLGPVKVPDKVPELALASLGYINADIRSIKENYIKLGFHLDECLRCEYYRDFGYYSFNDFVYNNFGLDKSALSRCMSVFRRFADRDGLIRKMWIADEYKDYSYSQLCEMVSMKSEYIKRVKPDMTVSQIRDVKKRIKEQEYIGNAVVATSQLEDKKPKKIYSDSKNNSLSGAARLSYLKGLDSFGSVEVDIFDVNKSVEFRLLRYEGDLLLKENGRFVIRIDSSPYM